MRRNILYNAAACLVLPSPSTVAAEESTDAMWEHRERCFRDNNIEEHGYEDPWENRLERSHLQWHMPNDGLTVLVIDGVPQCFNCADYPERVGITDAGLLQWQDTGLAKLFCFAKTILKRLKIILSINYYLFHVVFPILIFR